MVVDRQGQTALPSLPELPVSEVLPALQQALVSADAAVLEAPPGAGKTTLVPLVLLDAPWLAQQKILMLEPRRVAARAAAKRMADLLGEPVGQTVGYRMRLERKVSAATRIEVITEGILTRLLQSDPALEGVGLVIFDEFHERSLDADLGLALTLQSRSLFRDDPLKVLVMSATLDGAAVASLLDDAPVIRSQGRQFPVSQHWLSKAVSRASVPKMDALIAAVVDKVLQALTEQSGNVLVFLPGQGEIARTQSLLESHHLKAVEIWPMHGALDLAAQQRAIQPPPAGVRKVVLATNIAQTSLTIEGIQAVVDAGLQREARFDPASGVSRLLTRRVSRDAAEQRAGRAGRLGPGHCYRLWTQEQHRTLAQQASPEILSADLSALALQLLAWGVDDPGQLTWLDPPPAGAYAKALLVLAKLGAIEKSRAGVWQLSAHGNSLSQVPASPRLAHLLLTGAYWGEETQAARLAALLMVGVHRSLKNSADLSQALALLSSKSACPALLRGWRERVLQQANRFLAALNALNVAKQVDVGTSAQLEAALLARAYPERIARRLGDDDAVVRYQLSSGRRVAAPRDGNLCRSQWLAVAEVGAGDRTGSERIFTALPLSPALFDAVLADQVKRVDSLQWDAAAGRVRACCERRIGELVLDSQSIQAIASERAVPVMLAMLRDKALSPLPWTDELRQWQARVMLLQQTLGDSGGVVWPDVSDKGLLDHLEHWLAPALDGVQSLSALKKIDLRGLLQGLLVWPLPRELERLAPQRLSVPSGSQISIDYLATPPVLAVKLQEMFGCTQTPTVADGRVALQLHLLSPARRPLQITQNLADFWSGSYEAVKKELKGRYPKHPWPDDPLNALPTAKTKRALR